MTQALEAFLHYQIKRPHIWGKSDCGTLIGDWVLARRGIDPCVEFRGKYNSFDGAKLNYVRWGGLPRAVGRALRRAGLRLTIRPERGDVGVIALAGSACGAICCGQYWFTRHERGPVIIASDKVRVIAAWKV